MLIEVLPVLSVVPVASACGNDCLVRGEGVIVVDSPIGALQSLRVLMTPDIVVERCHAVDIQVDGIVVGILFRKQSLGRFVQASREQERCPDNT